MKANHLRIVFMGTPEFAVPSLRILLEHDYNVVGVVTAPDKPAGRGLEPKSSAIKKFALEKNLEILQPSNLKSDAFLNQLKIFQPDLEVVVAFRMLPEVVWKLPGEGTFNLHASLLPQYRGAAPINWAIMNGETETGVTTFFIRHEIDTGKIIFQEKVPINKNETAGELHDKLKEAGAQLVLKTVTAIEDNNCPQTEQKEFYELKKAPKIFSEDCKINWENSVISIFNQIRGLSPYPGAFTHLNERALKIYSALIIEEANSHPFGKIITDNKEFLRFAARDGFIEVSELQMEGKKRMKTADFLRGYTVQLS